VTGLITDATDFVLRFLDQKFDFLRTGSPLRFDRPEIVKPGNFASIGDQGMTLTPAFFGLWVGVTAYTAAFIAEIVRGGILAVPKGQNEAGLALGLKRGQLLRMIVLPQAFRIILPPIGNQYLNLAKNTSLGIAIAYAEVVQVGQTLLNQTGQAIQVSLLWMAFYLTVSLSLSAVVNWYNRKLALVER
jgi:general L-amino acid transport system permease protein